MARYYDQELWRFSSLWGLILAVNDLLLFLYWVSTNIVYGCYPTEIEILGTVGQWCWCISIATVRANMLV
jgi:hypothetical protein